MFAALTEKKSEHPLGEAIVKGAGREILTYRRRKVLIR